MNYDEKFNLRVWTEVCTTDPSHTKRVDQRGGFTAIDAYHQIHTATRVFGPVGIGWGWHLRHLEVRDGLVIVALDMWIVSSEKASKTFTTIGAAGLMTKGSNPRLDDDAPKKALTDAITKGLSYLGFNADVFLGMFDDSKYVEKRKQDEREKRSLDILEEIKTAIDKCETEKELEDYKVISRPMASGMLKEHSAQVPELFRARLGELVINDDIPQ